MDKTSSRSQTLLMWLQMLQNGHNMTDYFVKHGYKNIAVYGIGDIGEMFLKELADSDINVAYVVDKTAVPIYDDVELYRLGQELPDCDVMVVTVPYYLEQIINDIRTWVPETPIVSIDDVIMNM